MESLKEYVIAPEDDGVRLDKWIRRNIPSMPFGLMQKLVRKGAVRVDGNKIDTGIHLKSGQIVRIPAFEDRGHKISGKNPIDPAKIQHLLIDRIIYRDRNILAINKPHGLATQGGNKVKISVDDLLSGLVDYERSIKLIHRLDKDTSGVLLAAIGDEAAREGTKSFKNRSFTKTYWALVKGVPSDRKGKIALNLTSGNSRGGMEKTIADENGKKAVTYYELIDTAGSELSWLALYPETGRKHQLRAHMAAIGYPIIGDGKYGGSNAFVDGIGNKMHLHSRNIKHDNFLGTKLDITAPLPEHMAETWDMLGFGSTAAICGQ